MFHNAAQPQAPVGKMLLLAYREPHLLGDTALRRTLTSTLDLVKESIAARGAGLPHPAIEEELFALRLQFIEHLQLNPAFFARIEKVMLQEIGSKLFLESRFRKLGEIISDSLEIYLEIFSRISNAVAGSSAELAAFDASQIPSLTEMRHLLLLQPSVQLELAVRSLETSVRLDYFLIVAELFIGKEGNTPSAAIAALIIAFKQSFVEFASYFALSGAWMPADEDERPLMRNIKIRSAALRLAYNAEGHTGTLRSLQEASGI